MPHRSLSGLLKSTVLRQSSVSLAVTVTGRVLTLILLAYLARVMGSHEFGKFSYVRNLVFMIGPVASLGFGPATSRFVPQALALGRPGEARGYMRYSVLAVIALTSAAALIACLWRLLRGASPPDGDTWAAIIALLAIPCYALLFIGVPAARALGKVLYAYIPNFILQPGGQLLVTFIIAMTASAQVGFMSASVAFLGSIVFAAAVQLWALRHGVNEQAKGAPPVYEPSKWLSVALPLAVSVVSITAIQRSAPVIVGAYVDPTLTGIFIACASLATTLSMPREAVNGILLPKISAAWALGNTGRVRSLVLKGAALAFVPTAVACLAVWYFAEWLLGLYGPAFVSGITLFGIMMLEQLVVAAAGPVGNVLSISGYHWALVRIQAGTAIARVLAVFAGMAWYNIESAAFGALCVMAASTAITALTAWRRLAKS